LQYGDSYICQHYKLPKQGTQIEVETRVHWNEKDKMLKLSVPVKGNDCTYLGQTAYGTQDLYADGTECVAQKWVAAVSRKDNLAATCINNSTYSSDFANNELRLTLLRSPAYTAHPDIFENIGAIDMATDRYTSRMDQGLRVLKFWFNGGKGAERNNDLIIRLFEPTGKANVVSLTLPVIGKIKKIALQGFEIKTLRLSSNNDHLACVDLLEKKVRQK
jgi:alpha-mannosidase